MGDLNEKSRQATKDDGDEADARQIAALLRRMFPHWRYRRTFYEDHNRREIGWKVMISRDPGDYDDDWQRAP